jgi:predicted nucleotidyltransferase
VPRSTDALLTFFVDRSLGAHDVPDARRATGARVEIHDDHFAPDPEVVVPSRGGTKDASLERLVRHVVEVMNPLEVWLFESRAENRARPTSDYDLLVVMPDGTPESELDPVRAWRLGWEVRVTADIIPCTRSEFDEEKHEVDSLPRAAVLRGRKIFERRTRAWHST